MHGNTIQSHNFQDTPRHEEANTLTPNQVLAAVFENPSRQVSVCSPDADVLTILIDQASCHVDADTSILFLTGKGTKYRVIDVRNKVLGKRNAKDLLVYTTSLVQTGVVNL